MDRTNTPITTLEERNKQTRIKKLVDYIIDNAPEEALVDFSKQFLTRDLTNDIEKFESSWKLYEEHMATTGEDIYEGRLIKFPE
jgi:hypothetical protein